MTDSKTAEQIFKREPQLLFGHAAACVSDPGTAVFIEADTIDGQGAELILDVKEATALRDWLNKVCP